MAGRPLKFETPEAMQEQIDAYFADCKVTETPITITGLALALDTSRESLCNYENRDEFFDTIKRAKLRVENSYEIRLLTQQATGPIFALKNFGWKDTQTLAGDSANPVKHEHKVTLSPEDAYKQLLNG